MKKFTFKVENPAKAELYIDAVADTPSEAAEAINDGLADEDYRAGQSIYLGSEIRSAEILVTPTFQVDESMIVAEEDFSDDDLNKAYEFLTGKGYYCDLLAYGFKVLETVEFSKSLFTEDGTGIYAMFTVKSRFERDIKRHSFRIEAVLYPVSISSLKDEGTATYSVHFSDRQATTTIEHLPQALDLYEEKFLELIRALRRADPFDGLPLEDDELIN